MDSECAGDFAYDDACFFGLGYAIVFVLKRFVPEVFEALQSLQPAEEMHAEGSRFERNIGDSGEGAREVPSEAVSEEQDLPGAEGPKLSTGIDFEPMDKAELKRFNSRADVAEGEDGQNTL
jgi:hypothetical protein